MTAAYATRFAGQNVVVTGAASGIGAATALRFADEGARVLLVDRAPAEAPPGCAGLVADVATEGAWERVAQTVSGWGGADVLVSNAGVQIAAPLTALSLADWETQLAVNVRGAFLGLRALLPDLSARGGSAVVTSSVHARFGMPGHPAYAASKGALDALVRQVAVDYAPVRVNSVIPGPIRTPGWDQVPAAEQKRSVEQTALKRFGLATEVAAVVSFLASADASYVTGAAIVVDGGWSVVKEGT